MKFSIFKRLSRFSIRKQLFIIYLPLILLSTLVIGGGLVLDSTKQLTNNYQNLSALNAQRIKSTLFDTTNTFLTSASSLSSDTNLRTILTTDYSDLVAATAAVDSYSELTEMKTLQTSISKLAIYTTNQTLPQRNYFVPVTTDILNAPWYQKAMSQSNAFFYTDEKPEYQANLLSLYKSIPLPLSNQHAVLQIQLDYNYLSNRLRNRAYDVELSLDDDVLFYSDDMQRAGKVGAYKAFSENKAGERFVKLAGQNVLLAESTLRLPNIDNVIHVYSGDEKAYPVLRKNLVRWSAVIVLVILTTGTVMLLFARFFSKRLQILQMAVFHAASEDYSFFQNISGEDEVSQISLNFHKIIQHIKSREEDLFKAQLTEQQLLNQQQQMEFSILAGQINPHFLFNTLETIRMMALKSGNTDVAYAIKLLAKSMRYTLEVHGTQLITLEKSLDAIEVYVKIQRMRFGDRVNFSYQISQDINPKKIEILPLIIQPLVENAITHGLEGLTTKGTVRLTINRVGEHDIRVAVQDNGTGISEETLKLLRLKIQESSSNAQKNIGLRNVNHRAKMFYGEGYGITLDSLPDQGTTVTLLIHDLKIKK